MGGAGFPTGRKWTLVAKEPATPKYVICNADESEPGTFKDREVLRDLSHLVIEGMTLAGYCIGAESGWVFIRHEYEPERVALQAAIDAAYAAGALGKNIFGSDLQLRNKGLRFARGLHPRRRDRAARVHGGPARRAAQQAAVSRRRGTLEQADLVQQRRNLCSPHGNPAPRR